MKGRLTNSHWQTDASGGLAADAAPHPTRAWIGVGLDGRRRVATGGIWILVNKAVTSICLKYFPLLVLKGLSHYWKYIYFSRGLNQMEGEGLGVAR